MKKRAIFVFVVLAVIFTLFLFLLWPKPFPVLPEDGPSLNITYLAREAKPGVPVGVTTQSIEAAIIEHLITYQIEPDSAEFAALQEIFSRYSYHRTLAFLLPFDSSWPLDSYYLFTMDVPWRQRPDGPFLVDFAIYSSGFVIADGGTYRTGLFGGGQAQKMMENIRQVLETVEPEAVI